MVYVDPDGTTYWICPFGSACVPVSDAQFAEGYQQPNGGITGPPPGQSGPIICGGQICGYVYYDPGVSAGQNGQPGSYYMSFSGGAAGGSTTPTTTIGPDPDPDAKKKYCSGQADKAALEDLLPGVMRGHFQPSTVIGGTLLYGGHAAVEVIPEKPSMLRYIRSQTNIPMSTTSKFMKWGGYIMWGYAGYTALKASRKEYKACME